MWWRVTEGPCVERHLPFQISGPEWSAQGPAIQREECLKLVSEFGTQKRGPRLLEFDGLLTSTEAAKGSANETIHIPHPKKLINFLQMG